MRHDVALRPEVAAHEALTGTRPMVATTSAVRGVSRAAALAAGFAALTALLYFASAHFQAATSDSATLVLQGRAMAHGNPLLHGWNLTYASFWTSTALFDAVAILAVGLHPGLMYVGPAVFGALCVFAGVAVARQGGRGGAAIVAGGFVATLLVFSAPAFNYFFVAHGFHVSTAAYALVAFALIFRRRSFGLAWVAAVLVLAIGTLGDLMLVVYAAIPLILVGVVMALRERHWRAGLVEAAAGAASIALAVVARLACEALGTFRALPALKIDHGHQMLSNLAHIPLYVASLLGLTNTLVRNGAVSAPLRTMTDLAPVHVIAAAAVLACFIIAFARLIVGVVRPGPEQFVHEDDGAWRIDNLLVVAVVCAAAPFVLLGGERGGGSRYLMASAIFAIVLAGRMLARAYRALERPAAAKALAGAAVALGLALAASFGVADSSHRFANTDTQLASFLEAHHLHSGVGGYWQASIITASTSGTVDVRPVAATRRGHIRRMSNLSSAAWYRGKTFQFFVYNAGSTVGPRAAEITWGRPAHTYTVGIYRVLVWDHPLRIPAEPATD